MLSRARRRCLWIAFVLGSSYGCKEDFTADCPMGNENCECGENDACLDGLECRSGVCVGGGETGAESESMSESSAEASESVGEASESSEATTGDGDGDGGDGDGDGSGGDGDGDGSGGDGDGDGTGGDGDGDGDGTGGDGDGDGSGGDGDGDGDGSGGDGDGDGDETGGDGDGDGDGTGGDGDGDGDACVSDGGCAENEYCDNVGPTATNQCTSGCHPFLQPCTGGLFCRPKSAGAGWSCQVNTGAVGEAGNCTSQAQCDDGLICDESAGQCVALCEADDAELCTGGQDCVDLWTTFGSDYDGSVGSCDPPSDENYSVSVSIIGGGGTVTDNTFDAMSCTGASCLGTYVAGTTVTLDAVGPANFDFITWTSGPCMGSVTPSCTFTVNGAVGMGAQFNQSANMAFVTSEVFGVQTGGGRAAFDAACQTVASDAGFPGTFLAFVHDSTGTADARFTGFSGWVRTDGQAWAQDMNSLMNSWEQFYPLLDEAQNQPGSFDSIWLGETDTCVDWTSNLVGNGSTETPDSQGWWSNSTQSRGCGTSQHLVCLETTMTSASVSVPAPGASRLVFKTPAGRPTSSVADFDIHCNTVAGQNGLTGTFTALVATTSSSAPGRLTQSGANWYREDNVPIAASVNDFVAGNWISAPTIDAEHNYGEGSTIIWSGSDDFTAPAANIAANCNNFTSNTVGDSSFRGLAGSVLNIFGPLTFSCSNSLSLICVEN